MKAESSFNNMIVVSKSKMSNDERCQQRFLKVVIIFSLEMSNTYATPEAESTTRYYYYTYYKQ